MSKASRKERRKLLSHRPPATDQSPASSPPQQTSPATAAPRVLTAEGIAFANAEEWVKARCPPFDGEHVAARRGFDSNPNDNPDLDWPESLPSETSSNPLSDGKCPAGPTKSSGPVTPAGKARSAQNSFKHGLAAGFSHFKLLSGEDPAEYAELAAEVRAQFLPRTNAERHKIDDMAQAWWLQRRARNMQTSALESGDDKALALYLRYETTQRRCYQSAYKDFEDMQKHRVALVSSSHATLESGRSHQPQCPQQSAPTSPAQTETEALNPQPLAA